MKTQHMTGRRLEFSKLTCLIESPNRMVFMIFLLAASLLSGISSAIAQPLKMVPKEQVQSNVPLKALDLKTYTYNGKQGGCEQLPPDVSQEGAVETAPPPRLPSSILSDLAVLGVKHMSAKRDGKEYVKVVTKIANNSDEPMRTDKYKVFYKIGGESNACIATLPQLDPHQIVTLTREVQLNRGFNYGVTVIVDFFNTEQEVDENNNKFTYTINMK